MSVPTRRTLIAQFLALSSFFGLGSGHDYLFSQTQEVSGMRGPVFENPSEITQSIRTLKVEMSVHKFKGPILFKDFLEIVHEELSARKLEMAFLIDLVSIAEASPGIDLLETPIIFRGLGEHASVRTLLSNALDQVACKEIVMVIRPGRFLEISTKKCLEEEPTPFRAYLSVWSGREVTGVAVYPLRSFPTMKVSGILACLLACYVFFRGRRSKRLSS